MRVREAKEISVGRAGKLSKSRKSFPRARNIHAGNGHSRSLCSAKAGREISKTW